MTYYFGACGPSKKKMATRQEKNGDPSRKKWQQILESVPKASSGLLRPMSHEPEALAGAALGRVDRGGCPPRPWVVENQTKAIKRPP